MREPFENWDVDAREVPRVHEVEARPRGRGVRLVTRMVAVIFLVSTAFFLLDSEKGVCASTPSHDLAVLSGLALLVRPAWRVLKFLNDGAERGLARWTGSAPGQKPPPSDDC